MIYLRVTEMLTVYYEIKYLYGKLTKITSLNKKSIKARHNHYIFPSAMKLFSVQLLILRTTFVRRLIDFRCQVTTIVRNTLKFPASNIKYYVRVTMTQVAEIIVIQTVCYSYEQWRIYVIQLYTNCIKSFANSHLHKNR